MFLLSFLILFELWFFILHDLGWRIVTGFSILLIFVMLLFSLIRSIFFLVTTSLLSALLFVISFSLTLDFVCSSVSSYLRHEVRLFILPFALVSRLWHLSLWTFLLDLLLLHPINFGMLHFHFVCLKDISPKQAQIYNWNLYNYFSCLFLPLSYGQTIHLNLIVSRCFRIETFIGFLFVILRNITCFILII